MTITKNCPTCGMTFQAERSRNRFCSRPCFNQSLRTGSGYVQTTDGLEHRRMMERHLGRTLRPEEHVHHKNGDKRDNRIANLEVLSVQRHTSLHKSKHPKQKACAFCGQTFTPHPQTRGRVKTCSKACRYEQTARTRLSRGS